MAHGRRGPRPAPPRRSRRRAAPDRGAAAPKMPVMATAAGGSGERVEEPADRRLVERDDLAAVVLVATPISGRADEDGVHAARRASRSAAGTEALAGAPRRSAATRSRPRRSISALVVWVVPEHRVGEPLALDRGLGEQGGDGVGDPGGDVSCRRALDGGDQAAALVEDDRVRVGPADVDAEPVVNRLRHRAPPTGTGSRSRSRTPAARPWPAPPRCVHTGADGERDDDAPRAVPHALGRHRVGGVRVDHGDDVRDGGQRLALLEHARNSFWNSSRRMRPASSPVPSITSVPRTKPPSMRRSISEILPVISATAPVWAHSSCDRVLDRRFERLTDRQSLRVAAQDSVLGDDRRRGDPAREPGGAAELDAQGAARPLEPAPVLNAQDGGVARARRRGTPGCSARRPARTASCRARGRPGRWCRRR